jgi:autotransporter-associated beta strand protein
MANTQALGTTTANITLNGTTLVVATAGGDTPYNFTLGSNLSASIVSDVASGSVGINHTLGNFSVGGSAAVGGTQINVLAGAGITSGSPSITVGLLNMTSGAASAVITTVNPTTANLIIGNVSNNSATAANTRTLNLDGTSQGNRITGTIAEGSVAPTIITKSNTSTWTLSGASTYIGATTVTAGTLTFDATSTYNPANGIAGLMTINGATAVVNLAGAYNTSNGNGNAIFQIQGGGTLNFTGTSNLSLTTAGAGIRIGEASAGTFNMTAGTFNYTVITGSNLVVGRTSGGNGTLNISGGTFTFNGAGTGGFILSNDANTTSTVNLSNTGSLIVNGSVFRIGGTATSTATINLDGGTFTLAVSPTAAGTSVFNFNGGLFKSNAALAVGSLTRANVRNGGANFDTFGGTITMNQALEHSNVLGDNAIDGGLTKTGTGSLTLTDVNTYTGNTTVSNGSLTLSGSGSIATSSTVILAAAGTLSTAAVTGGTNFDATSNQFALASGQTLKGTGTVSGPITVRAASILAPGASPGALTLTTGLTTQANGTFAIGVYDGTTPALPTTGLSSVNANSNNFLTITGGTTVIDAGTLIAIDAGATTFTDGVAYSYLVASGAGVGDQSTLSITNPSQFTFASSLGYTASGFSLTGDNGNIYLNFTPVVPEPALIGFITLAGLGLSSVIRRRPSTTV